MDQGSGGLEEDLDITKSRQWWGLRPWKRHSTIQMVVGFLFVLAGTQYIIAKPIPGREIALAVVLQVAPLHIWGIVFVIAGLLSMLSSRWPPFAETWGYMVLTGLSSGWAASYFTGIVFMNAPASNVSQVIIWGCLAFIWWAVSGLPNPDAVVVITNGQE
jgi:hypothetical protein